MVRVFDNMSVVLDPIPTTGLTAADVDELTRKTHNLFMEELVALTEKARGKPVALPAQQTNGDSKISRKVAA